VNVSAKDKGTGKEQRITIQASGGLSDDDIEKMVKEAEENAEADKKRRAVVEAKNQAESLIHSTEKSLSEHGDKVDEPTKDGITAAVAALREVLDGEDADEIQARTQALAEASMKLGEAIYKSEAEAAGGEAPEGEPAEEASTAQQQPGDDDVVDAEYEEVDENGNKRAS
ncbi:MAG: Hsp70 family protein, partial [Pseudomonadota bacterium]